MILNTVKRRRSSEAREPEEPPVAAFSSTLAEKPKRGRRTIPDNFLLGARNAWGPLLEESWPEIGWPLLQIRKSPTRTIDDVRRAFEPVKDKPHGSGWAAGLYSETFETATPADVRRSRIRVQELQGKIISVQAKLAEAQRAVSELDSALKTAGAEHTSMIETEITKRRQTVAQLELDVNRLTTEERNVSKKCSDQEAYVYASELLDFLHSPGRYAVKPLSVANALAGLPTMRWRQSYSRCARMRYQGETPDYRVLKIFIKLCKRHSGNSKKSLVEFFRSELLKLPKKLGYARDFVWQNWRDLRLAIEECGAQQHDPGELPYVLTSVFMRNTRTQKNSVERILAEQERLLQL